jgi:S-formylglutathione hydrolase FrmB
MNIPARLVVAAMALALASPTARAVAQVGTNAPPVVAGAKPVAIERIKVHAPSIEGNLGGESADREVLVVLPPGYAANPKKRYPVIYALHGYSIGAEQWTHEIRVPQTVEGAFAKGAREMIIVLPDSKTGYGGSMYSSSVTTGDFETFIARDLVAYVDAHYRTLADRDHRAITGKSSGGYGAMITPMLRPDLFGALATHAGDAQFDVCYRTDFPNVARDLRDTYGGPVDAAMGRFLTDFRGRIAGTKKSDMGFIEQYGYAACYSADEDGTVRQPFDDTGQVIPEIWDRWLAWDPVLMAARPEYAEALRSLKAVWIDAGTRDEYFLDFGAVAFRRAIEAAGVPDESVYFELFDAGHGAIEYRYPLALAWLAERLSP